MKRLVIALLALAVSFSAMAQKPQNPQSPHKGQDHERFEAEKVAYITQQLSLTVEEAQAFWPVYNQAVKEQREVFAKIREAKRALREAINEGKSDAEVKPLLDTYLKVRADKRDPMAEHRADFVKAVGESKTAKFYLSEDSFRNKALREMAGHGTSPRPSFGARQNGPRPDGKPQGGRPDGARPDAQRPSGK